MRYLLQISVIGTSLDSSLKNYFCHYINSPELHDLTKKLTTFIHRKQTKQKSVLCPSPLFEEFWYSCVIDHNTFSILTYEKVQMITLSSLIKQVSLQIIMVFLKWIKDVQRRRSLGKYRGWMPLVRRYNIYRSYLWFKAGIPWVHLILIAVEDFSPHLLALE